MRKSGISWRKSHSFYTTRGIPLKDRRSIDILRAHEKRNCILSRASTAWSSRQYSLEVTPQPQASFTKLHGQWPIANGKKGTSFRESAPFPAWKHLEADPWGATSRRHTGKHSDGWCAQPLAKKTICPDSKTVALQWRYKSFCHILSLKLC